MEIGIIGMGYMGAGLGRLWAQAGRTVTSGSRRLLEPLAELRVQHAYALGNGTENALVLVNR